MFMSRHCYDYDDSSLSSHDSGATYAHLHFASNYDLGYAYDTFRDCNSTHHFH